MHYCAWVGLIDYISLINAGLPEPVASTISLGTSEICYGDNLTNEVKISD